MTLPKTLMSFALMLLAHASNAAAASPAQYFCTVDASTGFSFRNGEWVTTNFKDRQKYILKEVDAEWAGANYAVGDKIWKLVEVGQEYAIATCSDWWKSRDGTTERINMIRCEGFTTMILNKRTLRFLSSYQIGYVDGVDENENTPSLSIGKCSPL